MSASEPGLPSARPGAGWLLRTAWRDSRGQRRLLLLFVFCIVFGVAALVAIRSLRTNLETAIETQSRALVGADLVLSTRQPPGDALEAWVAARGGEHSREWRFRSMAYFPGVEEARFVQVRALEPGFPFYGTLETAPADAVFRGTVEGPPRALVEEGLLSQFGLGVGDEVVLGETTFVIAGALQRVAGESELTGFFAPRVFIDFGAAQATGLVQTGSVVSFRHYLQLPDGLDERVEAALASAERGLFIDEGVRVTTVEERQESIGEALRNLFSFLNLVGFVALLLGGLGVGGAVQVYLQPKLESVAVLRCLGASVGTACGVYLVQIAVVGFGGALLGALLGVAVQLILPQLLAPFLPFAVEVALDPPSILLGLLFGWLVATLFALRPLLRLRHVSPLRALRASFEPPRRRFDGAQLAVTVALVVIGVGFSLLQTEEVWQGLAFVAGLGLCFGLLAACAVGLRAGLRRTLPARWPFAWRLALSNLYRPQNRTVFLVTTLGLGTLLMSTLYLARGALLAQIAGREDPARANVILVDVQPDQLEGVRADLEAAGLEAVEALPVVTMRVSAIKDRSLRAWREDPESPVDDWVYSWEFRSTYRDHVLDNAEIVAGEFTGVYEGAEPVPISLADGLLDDFGVGVGDTLTWDVQGVPIRTVVGSVRAIDWQLGRQNFGVLWPRGMIEAAPSVFAVTTRTENREATLALQQVLRERHSNVSLVDLSLVYETIDDVLTRVAFIIQFMAAFTVLTGLIVLFGAVATSRYQRLRESVLLRTLGASGGLVRRVLTVEYAVLGALAAVTGLGLSVLASWAMMRWVFEVPFTVPWMGLFAGGVLVVALTVGAGWLGARGITSRSPLAVLREEG